MAGIRIILDGDLTYVEVKSALDELGFSLERELPANAESPLETLFQDAEGRMVRYTEDSFICVKYLDVGEEVPNEIVGRLRLLLPYYAVDEIHRNARANTNSEQDRIDWMMSATALEFSDDRKKLIDLLTERLKDFSPAVRMAALRAGAWLAWPELKPLVQELVTDKDADVAGFA